MKAAHLIHSQGFLAGSLKTAASTKSESIPKRLSELPHQKKKQLWVAIKAQDPERAKLMKNALADVRAHFPSAELAMQQEEIERYLANK